MWVVIYTVLGSGMLTNDARDQTLVLKNMITKTSLADLDHEIHCEKGIIIYWYKNIFSVWCLLL